MRCRLSQILALLRPPPSLVTYCSFSSSPSGVASATAELLKIGDVLKESRRFSEADVEQYAKVSGDVNRVHFDADFARRVAGFEGRIVHGMLVASLFPTVIASHFPGAIYVSQTLRFKLPVYIEDEVIAEVQPFNLRVNKEKFIGKFSTKCFTSGRLVLEGEATTILPTLRLLNSRTKDEIQLNSTNEERG